MTHDKMHRMENAIRMFSDPFERALSDVVRDIANRAKVDPWNLDGFDVVELQLEGCRAINDYEAKINQEGSDADACFQDCAIRLAEVAGADPNEDFVSEKDFTFGRIQYVINKTMLNAYVDRFWDYTGRHIAEGDERKLHDWFHDPDSPRHRFRKCNCLMDDDSIGRVVREYRKTGEHKAFKMGRWSGVAWRRLVFPEAGDRGSVAWYDKFQGMVEELAERQGVYPLEYRFGCQPGA